MGFADNLRKETVTKKELKLRKERAIQYQIESSTYDVIKKVKEDAQQAAHRGEHSLSKKYGISTYEGRNGSMSLNMRQRKMAREISSRVKAQLIEENFRYVHTFVKRDITGITLDLLVTVRW